MKATTRVQFRADNHFVPATYLKRWSHDGARVWMYRLLVSHENVPPWKERSIRGIGYHRHLYTRLVGGAESDEFERWLGEEIEAPAEEALEKVTAERRLSSEDWRRLIRFIAAQHVRTPARYVESIERWNRTVPELVDSTLKRSVAQLERAARSGRRRGPRAQPAPPDFPAKVVVEKPTEKGGLATIRAEVVVGRGLWIHQMRLLLDRTWTALRAHRWKTLLPPDGFEWITSDDPVVPLNYYGAGWYDFKGGWGNKGTELLIPLSPRHLLYTKVGFKDASRSRVVDVKPDMAEAFQRFLAEHAHRAIFAASPTEAVAKARPRTVDAVAFHAEGEAWNKWPEQQSRAERE